jgi:DNA-binding MarR family transcriptional regulator
VDIEHVVTQMRRMGRLIRRLSRRLDKSPGKRKSRHPDLTLSQMRTIWLLHEADSYTMSELAARSDVSRPAATSNADALEKLGVLERFADPSDRRVVRVRLSADGRKWVQDHRKRHRESMMRILSKLTDAERAELAQTLEKVLAILGRVDPAVKE